MTRPPLIDMQKSVPDYSSKEKPVLMPMAKLQQSPLRKN